MTHRSPSDRRALVTALTCRARVAAAAGLGLLLTLTACGSGSGGSGPTSGSGAAVASDSALHGKLPADIRSRGSLTVAIDATIGAPFASFATDNKTMVGLNVDMAQALAQLMGVKLVVQNVPFDSFIPGLQAKRYDFSVSVMLDTKVREQTVDFVDYIKDGSGFLVRKGDGRSGLTLGQLCGMKVAAITGSVESGDLSTQSKACTAAGKKPVAQSIFAQNNQGILALISGRVDAWVGGADQNAWLEQQNDGKIVISGQPFNAAIDGIPMAKGSPLVPVMRQALQTLMDNGTYRKLLQKYGVQSGAVDKATLDNAQF